MGVKNITTKQEHDIVGRSKKRNPGVKKKQDSYEPNYSMSHTRRNEGETARQEEPNLRGSFDTQTWGEKILRRKNWGGGGTQKTDDQKTKRLVASRCWGAGHKARQPTKNNQTVTARPFGGQQKGQWPEFKKRGRHSGGKTVTRPAKKMATKSRS